MTESVNRISAANRKLQTSLDRCQAILDGIFRAAPYGIGLVSNQVIQQVNSRLCDMVGYAADALREQHIGILYARKDELVRVNAELARQREHKGAGTIETQWQNRSGDIVNVRLNWVEIELADATLELCTALDITAQKQTEAEHRDLERMLQQAQKMEAIGTLAGGIAHDFNNILSPILIQTEMALLDLPDDSLIRLNLEDVLDAGNRARELVRQILAFSRQGEEERTAFKVSTVVKDALKLLRATLPATIEIKPDIQADSEMIMADATQIHQVLMNLCTNASQAMQTKGGELVVGLEHVDLNPTAAAAIPDLEPGSYLKIKVSDTGDGMDHITQERIFDPYFTTKEKTGGTGMGLAVVHGIIRSYEGAITFESELGKGTTFWVFLPCLERESPMKSIKTEPLPTGDERILLVDDEKAIIDAIQQMLERLGYQVVARTSSVEALEVFRSQPESFDLLLTDQTMQGMTGEALAKKVMAIRSDIPIVLCTGFSHNINEEKAKSMGIREFIMKPVLVRELAVIIRRLLDEN